ncbi:nucleotidyltransferase domain-containing protein [Dactylosporangium sp. CA-139066]|uniref:nucleotidyltransferase domain-containing protein n=1 Tax=Dactylosporangium sp. CA-139066 TaxID=3239930 RepID=UPI003D8B4E85
MTVTRRDIETWSVRPPSFLPEWTSTVLREALADAPVLRDRCEFEMYLQGSYANETNISGHSDVDLVVQMQLPFEERIDRLGVDDEKRFWERYGNTEYGWPQFRADVLARLRESFFVHEANKCIDIRHFDSALRIPADIVPAVEYRDYSGFPANGPEVYDEGIFFRDRAGNPIINFPKQHLRNGRRKDAATDRRFKPMVRIFKNARLRCDQDLVDASPSYFVECLVYNIDDRVFRQPLREAYPACLRWLREHLPKLGEFRCQNELVNLFGTGRGEWRTATARELVHQLIGDLPRQ